MWVCYIYIYNMNIQLTKLRMFDRNINLKEKYERFWICIIKYQVIYTIRQNVIRSIWDFIFKHYHTVYCRVIRLKTNINKFKAIHCNLNEIHHQVNRMKYILIETLTFFYQWRKPISMENYKFKRNMYIQLNRMYWDYHNI